MSEEEPVVDPALDFLDVLHFMKVKEKEDLENRRLSKEGQAVLNAKHILNCGVVMRTEEKIQFFSLVISSTGLSNKPPYEVKVSVDLTSSPKSIDAHCGCKAGGGGACKHIGGVILHLQRVPLCILERTSCTDLRQQWGKLKKVVEARYAPIPIREMCHLQKEFSVPGISPPLEETLLSKFVKSSESALSGLFRGRGVATPSAAALSTPAASSTPYTRNNQVVGPNTTPMRRRNSIRAPSHGSGSRAPLRTISSNVPAHHPDTVQLCNSLFLTNPLEKYIKDHIIRLSQCHLDYFQSHITITKDSAIALFLSTVNQDCMRWLQARGFRITGSRSYDLFTFSENKGLRCSPAEWTKMLQSVYESKFKGNKHTRHGKETEKCSVVAYEKQTGQKIIRMGFAVNPHVPWFGYSGDGAIVNKSVNRRILYETKSPEVGKSMKADDCVNFLPYIKKKGNKYVLHDRHKYYGQVQLGMALLDFPLCHFAVYSSLDNRVKVIEVPRDDDFLTKYLSVLTATYFKRVLPYLFARHNSTKT